MNASEKLRQLRAERCAHHDRIDELVVEMRAEEAGYQQRQAARQSEIGRASDRIAEIKNECAALESLDVEPTAIAPTATAPSAIAPSSIVQSGLVPGTLVQEVAA